VRGQWHRTNWFEAKATGDIPAFGVVEITGATWVEPNRTILEISQPSSDSVVPFAINSHKPIASGSYGMVSLAGPVYCLYDNGNSPATGETWGPQSGSFEAKNGNTGLVILGAIDTEKGIVLVDDAGTSGSLWWIGKTTELIASETTGQVQKHDQLWVATSEYFTVLNPHEVDLPLGLRVRWTYYPGWTDLVVEPFDYTEC
jgi:hypothetical protein